MMQKITVSAPGKLILMGEHAVVYGKPAIIAAVDKRCRIIISARNDNKITINSKNFKKEITSDFEKISTKFKNAEKDWKKFDKNNDDELLKSITKEPLDYPQIIIGQFMNYYNLKTLSGFDLMIDSEIPVGAGMGSSAALAVSIIGALYLKINKKIDKNIVSEIAYRCEKIIHGHPSGGDKSASTFGGFIWFQKDKGVQPLNVKLPQKIIKNFYIINTGTPDELTGEMVGLVKNLYQNNPKEIEVIFNVQKTLTEKFLEALIKDDEKEIIKCIKKAEKNLEKLGVVSPSAISLIKEIEKSGGTSKISGAGGKKNNSGIILIYHKNLQILTNVLKSHNLNVEQLTMGTEGVRQEL